ncbi:MAG: SpoIIE family protein phosphatase [Anaerolineales bacterium]|nr:SpoIIE family protein phosphatase [Anaerolineales bacterium]MCS7247091.1 SpoIIE family protein phosphatase [Anaerolineales bacterium]MDW8160902.1 SpoIIE family protein phosphatase [Anaerolineales bacterium]MDW8446586.1 SpoIIE family protein phosphatase [Anaerolineales bacterium]
MEVQIAVAKIPKFGASESGDTVEVIERPQGGISVVLSDGQTSGRGAKSISNLVVRKVISLLAEGVRDGAAARAASDYLYTHRSGKVSATLNICSVDLVTKTLVITRNNPTPVVLFEHCEMRVLDEESKPVGVYRGTRPVIVEVRLANGLCAVVFSDGLTHAGSRTGNPIDLYGVLSRYGNLPDAPPQVIADSLLRQAVELDGGRPSDDISIVVVKVLPHQGDQARRMVVRLPIDA